MFRDSKSFNQPLGAWDIQRVTILTAMFQGASSFNQGKFCGASWVNSNAQGKGATGAAGMFHGVVSGSISDSTTGCTCSCDSTHGVAAQGVECTTNGAKICSACQPGYKLNKYEQCVKECGLGKYFAGGVGTGACQPCGRGMYAAIIGMSACKVCDAGKFSSLTGRSNCTLCPAGKTLEDQGTTASAHDSKTIAQTAL